MKVQYYNNQTAFKSYEIKHDSFRKLEEPELSAVKKGLDSDEMAAVLPKISKGVRLALGLNPQDNRFADVLIKKGKKQSRVIIPVPSLYETVPGFNFLSFLERHISDFKTELKPVRQSQNINLKTFINYIVGGFKI